jgi:hypothetical protein
MYNHYVFLRLYNVLFLCALKFCLSQQASGECSLPPSTSRVKSVVSLSLILPRKSIVSPPSISPPMHADSPSQFLIKQLKLSLKTNYSTMELFYFKQQTKTPSPTKLATATSLAKKTYDESFTKVNCQIHPSVIPFLTPMNLKETYNEQLSNAKILHEPQHPHFCKDSTNCAHPDGELLSRR